MLIQADKFARTIPHGLLSTLVGSAALLCGCSLPDESISSGRSQALTPKKPYSVTRVQVLVASASNPYDYFGTAVALSGDDQTLVVGAPARLDEYWLKPSPDWKNASGSGSVYVFVRSVTGAWTEKAQLAPASRGALDGFGRAVAISHDGTTILVGAPHARGSKRGGALAARCKSPTSPLVSRSRL